MTVVEWIALTLAVAGTSALILFLAFFLSSLVAQVTKRWRGKRR